MSVCATCGAPGSEGSRFCPSCGARLTGPMPHLRKTITALFCDLVDSTPLGESLADPEAIHDVLTRYLRAVKAIIERHGGAVEKFAGDAVLGVFGVPVTREDDALRAVRAAVEMRDAVASLNDELRARWAVELRLKIGINSGEVLVGDSIAGQSLTLGDPMNVAARLESKAGPDEILLGESTARLIGDSIEKGPPRRLSLKGKSSDVIAYSLIRLAEHLVPYRFTRAMVGRAAELASLRDAYARAVREGRPLVMFVVGPPGIGKSRLAAAAASELKQEAAVYAARVPSHEEASAFSPLAEIVRAYAGIRASDDEATEKLARAVDAIVDDPGERAWIAAHLRSLLGTGGPDESRAVLDGSAAAWVRFLDAAATQRPLVLIFEDVHAADDAFLDLLTDIARGSAPILVVATARPDLDLTRARAAEVLRLEPLSQEEIGMLVDGVTDEGFPSDLRDAVIARAGGNPLFAEALATSAAETQSTPSIPATIDALVASRLDGLPGFLRDLVLDAAVVGSAVRAEVVAAVRGIDVEAAHEGLSDLARREFLREGRRSDAYEFWSDLVREIAYKQIPRSPRLAGHEAVARWLEETGSGSEATLAHHYGRAYDLAVEAREPDGVRRRLAPPAFHSRVVAAARALRAADRTWASELLARASDALVDIRAPDLDVIAEAGRLLVMLGSWERAIGLLNAFAGGEHGVIARELGIALCKRHRDDPGSVAYRTGQSHLERAAATGDLDAIASLAGTWKGIDERKVRTLYRRASDLDPTDPYPLGNLLEAEIEAASDLSPIEELRARLERALERCERQAAAGQNLPWAYFDLGKFRLFLGMPYESLDAYAKAIDLSPAAFMIETSLASLQRLADGAHLRPASTWVRRLLELALGAKFGDGARHERRVVILSGATSPDQDPVVASLGPVILEAFRDFDGSVISGGTHRGVSSLAGALSERYAGVRTVGYHPGDLPDGVDPDTRYDEIRQTGMDPFGPAEPLSYWADLLGEGLGARDVKVIGIGGGRVASVEYAIAAALGATVGVVRGSGGTADRFLADPFWAASPRVTALEVDAEQIRTFLRAPTVAAARSDVQ